MKNKNESSVGTCIYAVRWHKNHFHSKCETEQLFLGNKDCSSGGEKIIAAAAAAKKSLQRHASLCAVKTAAAENHCSSSSGEKIIAATCVTSRRQDSSSSSAFTTKFAKFAKSYLSGKLFLSWQAQNLILNSCLSSSLLI